MFSKLSAKAVVSLVLLSEFLFTLVSAGAAISNPTGYLVNTFFPYTGCEEGTYSSQVALALDTCVNSGVVGLPYDNTFMIYTYDDSSGNLTAYEYMTSDCSGSTSGIQLIPLNACSSVGPASYSYVSDTLPVFSGPDPFVQVTLLNYSATDESCSDGTDVVIYTALFENACQFDCGEGDLSCWFPSCTTDVETTSTGTGTGTVETNTTVNISYSYQTGTGPANCNYNEIVASQLWNSTCSMLLVCFDVPNIVSSSGDSLTPGAIAGVTIACLVLIAAVGAALYYYYYYLAEKPSSSSGGFGGPGTISGAADDDFGATKDRQRSDSSLKKNLL